MAKAKTAGEKVNGAAETFEAAFKNGILTVALPKTADAQKPVQKVEVKAA